MTELRTAVGSAARSDIRRELFIGGEWVPPSTSDVIKVENPATEEIFGEVPASSVKDVELAVHAASHAFVGWASTKVGERRETLARFADGIAARGDILAELVTREMGIPIELSRVVQADLPVAVLRGFIAAMETLDHCEQIGNSMVVREPAGVVAAITPWNYPIHQAVGKVGAALAAGCTVVLKPSELTPLSAYLLVEAAREAGIPPGVLNLVTGAGATGGALASHPLVDVVSFTGSTATGRRIMEAAAATIKRPSLELGGKSANVILPDADLGTAVRRGTEHVLENSGQTCTAWTRMLVPRHLRDDAIDIVRSVFRDVALGDPQDPRTTMGPLASRRQREIVTSYIETGLREGARVVAGSTDGWAGRGHFTQPVAFAAVDPSATIAQAEIFGPVLCILTFEDEDEALRIANDSPYGLSGAVWSRDEERAIAFARRMRTGQVSVNGGSFNPAAPFGGYKQSGIGRELGRHGLDDFLETKAIQL